MVYATLESFLEIEMISSWKEKLLNYIKIDREMKVDEREIEFNVYKLSILYADNKVEILDNVMDAIGMEQIPFTSTIDDFLNILENHIPIK